MEPVEYRGYWWQPGTIGEPISGTLNFVPGAPAKLRPIGSFKAPEDAFRSVGEPIIQGVSTNGKPITLYRCGETSSEVSFPGFTTTDYVAKILLVGGHFERPEDIAFPLIEISPSLLHEWIGRSGFSLRLEPPEGPRDSAIHYRDQPDISVSVRGFVITFTQSCNVTFGRGAEQHLVQRSAIRIAAPEPLHIEGLLQGPSHVLQHFISFGLGLPVFPSAVRVFSENPPSDEGIGVFYATRAHRRPAPHPAEMLFTLPDVLDVLEDVLGRWFDLADTVAPVLDLYFGALYGEATMYQQHQFLSLAQALESFHREVYDDNEKITFATRLQHLLNEAPRTVVERAVRDRDNFATQVRDTRNYFTHYNKKTTRRVVEGVELLNLIDRMRWLLEGLLLKQLGLQDGRVKRLLERNERLRQAGTASIIW